MGKTIGSAIGLIALLLGWSAITAGQNGTVMPAPKFAAYDNSGNPCSGCKLYTYSSGTVTPLATYSDVTLLTANANPVILDSAGRATIYLSANSYKFRLDTALDVTLWTQDTISATHAASAGLLTGTGDVTIQMNTAQVGSKKVTFLSGISVEKAQINENGDLQIDRNLTVGDGVAEDKKLVFDSAITDFHVGRQDSTDRLVIGRGQTLGTTPAFAVDINGAVMVTGASGCNVRLTLTSGTPVTTADVTGATTIYATPYTGNSGGPATCSFYDGTANWWKIPVAEVSIALGTITSGLPYDIFCYNNAGAMGCDAPLAWTNGTTRATALATQNGTYVKTGATTRLYIGTFYTTSTTQTEDSFAKRFVWNYYNRVTRALHVYEGTDSWTYTTATWRQAGGSTGNQVAAIIGVAEVAVRVRLSVGASNTVAAVRVVVSIAQDSVGNPAVPLTQAFGSVTTTGGNYAVQVMAFGTFYPAAGFRTFIWQEYSEAAGTTTWFGDNTGIDIGPHSGIIAELEG